MSRRSSLLAGRGRRDGRWLPWVVATVLVVWGVAGFAAALTAQRSLDDLADRGVPVTGTLLTASAGNDRYFVVAQFPLGDGTPVVADSNRFDRQVLDLQHGDSLDLLYDPADPSRFQGATWTPPQSLPWLGSAWLLLTVAFAAGTVVRAGSARGQDESGDADDPAWLPGARPRILARP